MNSLPSAHARQRNRPGETQIRARRAHEQYEQTVCNLQHLLLIKHQASAGPGSRISRRVEHWRPRNTTVIILFQHCNTSASTGVPVSTYPGTVLNFVLSYVAVAAYYFVCVWSVHYYNVTFVKQIISYFPLSPLQTSSANDTHTRSQ